MARQRLSQIKIPQTQTSFSIQFCWDSFIIMQKEKSNSKYTVSFYERFYKKLSAFQDTNATASIIASQGFHSRFVASLGDVNQQTINSYLRGLRAFGNYCVHEGFIESFSCPIKEVEPPVKQVYTAKELEKLMVKPQITHFVDFRTYCIISLILNTGARSNTILNIRICDVDLEEGFVNFNTTKSNKIVRLGLDRKTKRDLFEWIGYWRLQRGAQPTDFLFCNEYGEQMCRSTLCQSVARYNNARGVQKTSIHLFRHTFAKMWITSGGDIITLAKVLTHSELEMVRRYSNLYGSDIKKEMQEHSAISQLKTRSGSTIKNMSV